MNSYTIFLSKNVFKFNKLYIYVFILYSSINYKFRFVTARKFIYFTEKNENSELLLYGEIEDNVTNIETTNEDYYIYVSNNCDIRSEIKLHNVFAYRKDNFINFELLNTILESNSSENLNLKIECNFNLAYILKHTKNILSIPDEANIDHLNCLLLTLKCLKAKENKNLSEVIRGFSFKFFLYKYTNNPIEDDSKIRDVFSQNVLISLNFETKKLLVGCFLDYLMIKHDFFNENLIILKNTKDLIDKSLFNEHIPYNSLIINDLRLFRALENAFRNLHILNTFKVLLNELNIQSLILDVFKISELTSIDRILFFPLHIFKSIMLSNFFQSMRILIDELDLAINLNLEYFSLKNMVIDDNNINYFLQKHKLKGLVFDNVELSMAISFIELYLATNETLEYIEFKNVEMNFSWWINFLKKQNTFKVILSYNSNFEAGNFIQEFIKLDFQVNILLLEINFYRYKICKKFGDILQYFNCLKTLKLLFYQSEIDFEKCLHKSIINMENLEFFSIEIDKLDYDFFNCLFQMKQIKFLHLNNPYFNRQTIDLESTNNYKILSELYLYSLKISEKTLKEIFKYENLKHFGLKDCNINSISATKSFSFNSKNLKTLHLNISNLKIFEDLDILDELNCLEEIHFLGCTSYSCSLAYLNPNCNSKLKIISYQNGILQINDLNRLKQFTVIEKLDLSRCKFINCSFCRLDEDCTFFVSLKYLNLECVKLNPNDLRYLKRFTNLKILTIDFTEYHKIRVIFKSIPLKRFHFSSQKMFDKTNIKNLLKFLHEENIRFDFINLYGNTLTSNS